jgi:hypothetical protein
MHAGACYAQEADPRRQAAIATEGSVSPASGRGVGAAPRAPDDVGSRAHSLDRVTGLRAQGVEIVVEVQATVGRWKTKPRSREGSPKTTPVDIVVAFDDFAFVADLLSGNAAKLDA